MNVILVGRYATRFPYPEQEHDYPTSRALADRSESLTLIVQGRSGTIEKWQEGNLSVLYAPRGRFGALSFIRSALGAIRYLVHRSRVDVLNGSDIYGGAVALIASKLYGIPYVFQVQGDIARYSWGRGVAHGALVPFGVRAIARRAALVRTLFSESAVALRAAGVRDDVIRLVPSKCDTCEFDPSRYAKVERDSASLLFVGNIIPAKGVHELLDAFLMVAAEDRRLSLTYIGDGPDIERLRVRIEKLELSHRVTVAGRVPHTELPQRFAKAGIFVLPSHAEATPRVVMEALAMGVPVIATRVGGIPEMVEHGVTGLLVPIADATSIATAIREIRASPPWLATAAVRGREQVKARFSLVTHLDAMTKLHAEAGALAPPPPAEASTVMRKPSPGNV